MTKHTLNIGLLLRTGAILAGLAVLTNLAHGWQMRRHAGGQLAQADQAENDGRKSEAVVSLNRYLLFSPNDRAVRTRHALLLAEVATTSRARWQALEALRQVLVSQPNQRDVRRKAAELAFGLEQFSEARKHLEALVRSAPKEANLHFFLARCAEAEGDHAAALRALAETIRLVPDHFEAYARLAAVLRGPAGRPRQAEETLARMVKRHPKAARAFLVRARDRLSQGASAEAEQDLAQARRLAPADLEVLALSAQVAQRDGRFDEARGYRAEAVRLQPKQVALHVALAELERERGSPATAVVGLQQALREQPNQPDLLFALVDALIDQGERQGATDALARLKQAGGAVAAQHFLKGRLAASSGKWADAAQAFEQARERASAELAGRALQGLANCFRELGQVEEQVIALRRAADEASTPGAHLALAELLLDLGENQEAGQRLEALMKSPQAAEAGWPLLARARVRAQLAQPSTRREWVGAESALARASANRAHREQVAILRAEMLQARRQPEEARAVLERSRAMSPRSFALWSALAGLAASSGDAERAEAILSEARKRLGDSVAWRMARADLVVRGRSAQAGGELRELENGAEHFPAPERARLVRHLAGAHRALGDNSAVARLARQLVALRPRDLGARLLHVDAALALREDDTVRTALAELRSEEGPEGACWRWVEAALLLGQAQRGDRSGMRKAYQRVAEVRQRRPDWSRGPLLQARLSDLEGRTAEALNGYFEAVRLGDFDAVVLRRTTQLLLANHRHAEADAVLHAAQQRGALPDDWKRVAAEVALLARRYDRAFDLAREAVPGEARDYRDQLWLGQMLAAVGRPTESEEVLRQAVRRAGGSQEAWLSLIAQLARADRTEQAEQALTDMAAHLPAERVPQALAQAHELLGRYEQAAQEHRKAVAQAPLDAMVLRRAASFYVRTDQMDEAERLLWALLDSRVTLAEEDLPEVRRQLALVLSAGGGQGKRDLALKLLDYNRLEGESPADLRIRTLIQGGRAVERRSALASLESAASGALPAEERYRLAQLYEAENDWVRASAQLRQLLQTDEDNPAYLTRFVQALHKQGKKAEARNWLVRLERVATDAPRTRALREQLRKR